LLSAWNRRDWLALESLYAPDVVYESPHVPLVVGRAAMRRRDEELIALVPDLRSSELRITANDSAGNWATFKFVQTGTLSSEVPTPESRVAREMPTFVIHTTMFVRFDEHGRVAGLRTAHN
jgi:hypothetical protein